MKRIIKFLPKTKKNQAIAIIGAILFIVFLLVIGSFRINNKKLAKSEPPKSEPVITYSTDKPDESKTNADNYKWNGSPDEPKKIRISKIGVDAYVQKAGIDQDKKIAVPNNVHLAGWFADSQKPGQKGLSIISGHVSGFTTGGVFEKLNSLSVGDEFEVQKGDGSRLRYRIFEKKELKESESASYLFSQNPEITSQLNLITCGGKFDKASSSYESRVILASKLL